MTDVHEPSSTDSPVRVTHVFTNFYRLGGVHSRLQFHHDADQSIGISSKFIITREKQDRPQTEPRIFFLATDHRSSIRLLRHRFATAISKTKPDITMYHMTGNEPKVLTEIDRAQRRILDITMTPPYLGSWLRAHAHLFDGILSVSQSGYQVARDALPQFPRNRIRQWPQPLFPLPTSPRPFKRASAPLLLRYAGRLVIKQKRVDRLPKLFNLLDKDGLEYRFGFLGDGDDRSYLEGHLPASGKFLFHGTRHAEAYWETMSRWDAVLQVSEYEGLPRSTLEAMALGVLSIVPELGEDVEGYARQVDPALIYEPGNLLDAARAIRNLNHYPIDRLEEMRHRCREAVTPHIGGKAYQHVYREFVDELLGSSRISLSSSNSTSRSGRRTWRGIQSSRRFSLLAKSAQRWLRLN